MKSISENTPVTISLVLTIIGGVFWLSTLYAKVNNSAETVAKIELKTDQYQKTIEEINLRLTRIEVMLERRFRISQ